jgi:precorrin-2/cobalt-factor-2 C20-methyltransferase
VTKLGKLIGVGVGPGAPDLMTLRAVNVLRTVPVLAIPRRNAYSPSVAWRIAEPSVGPVEGQERLFLHFPMTKDPEILKPAWEVAFQEIGARLEKGLDVAFLTEGDAMVYSTFIYMIDEAKKRWPTLEIDVVPAVSSITAVPASTGVPLADGQERIAILPATYGVDDLADVLSKFDTTMLMKVSSVMPDVVEALERTGLLHKAVYVSKASTTEERVVRDVASIKNDRCDYFSMVVVSKKDRAGILGGATGPGASQEAFAPKGEA